MRNTTTTVSMIFRAVRNAFAITGVITFAMLVHLGVLWGWI